MPIQVHLEGGKRLEFMSLVDTDSQRRFLHNKVITLHAPELAERIHPFSAHSASGNPVKVRGQLDLIPCRIGTHQLVHNFLVAELPDLLAIVGMDYMEKLHGIGKMEDIWCMEPTWITTRYMMSTCTLPEKIPS